MFATMRIDELCPRIGDFAMRMAFLVSKKVLFLAWQGAAKPMLRCNDNVNVDVDLQATGGCGESCYATVKATAWR